MAFTDVIDLGCDSAIQLGGFNKKTKKENPTSAQGYYVGSRDIPSKFSKTGLAKLHVLQTPDGTLGVYGKTDLDPKMAVVNPGTMVKITNTGSVPTSKGNDMLKFRVQVDKDDTIEVNSIASSNANNADNDDEYPTVYENSKEDVEETSFEAEASEPDEIVPVRAQAPRQAAQAPSAAQIARVQAMLSKNRNAKSA